MNETTGSGVAKVRAERAIQKAQSFTACSANGTRSLCSTSLSDYTTLTDSSSTTTMGFPSSGLLTKANSSSDSLFGIGTFSLRTPTISSRLAIQATCMPDGAPWMYPASWCDCGTAKYTTTAECIFANLPSNPLTPVTTTSSPTNIPGPNRLPACAKYVATQQGYPVGIEDYCFCNGTLAPLLTHPISSSHNEALVTDCSYSLQPTNTAWSPSPLSTAIVAPVTPSTLITAISTTTTPLYSITTVFVLVTTLLPPPGRPTVYSTVYTDVPSSISTLPAIRQTFSAWSKCTNNFGNVDEAKYWANCVGGKCKANHNPFLNSQPWRVCSGCL